MSRHPVSGRGQPPGWFILHARKAADLNGTVLPAHPLATEPGTPVRIAFRSARTTPSLPRLEYEHGEPPPGADPGRPLYEGGAAAVRGGIASGAGLEPAGAGFRAPLGTPTPHPETVRKARFERADREV
jgi:hypothetical protein